MAASWRRSISPRLRKPAARMALHALARPKWQPPFGRRCAPRTRRFCKSWSIPRKNRRCPPSSRYEEELIMKIRKVRIHRFGGPEVLRLDEVEPSLPDASQVLVAVKAASVNPVDFKIRNGKYPAVKEDRLPYTLGRDVSGVVEKCGAQATAFKVGDEVFGIVGIGGGGYAEKAVLDEKAIARKPASLDDAHAAAIPLAGQTAWQGLFRYGELMAGQSILIH